ncbi:sulfate ABC transporter, permease protein CysW [compost metagenome]
MANRILQAPPGSRVVGKISVTFSALILLFLIAPLVVLVISSFNAEQTVSFPPSKFSLRWYAEVLSSPEWLGSFATSALLVGIVVPVVVVLATLGGYAVVRGDFPGRATIASLLLSPLLIPEVMTGLGLLVYFQDLGLLNTMVGMALGHIVVTLPFAARSVIISAQSLDMNLERAGASLGASRSRVFWTITVPLLRAGAVSGGIFAAVISLGEVAVSAFISGANTTTIPLRIMSSVQFELDPSAAAASTMLIVVSGIVMLVLNGSSKEKSLF